MESKFSRALFLRYLQEKQEMNPFEAFLFSFGSASILRRNLSTYPKRIPFEKLLKEEQKYLKRQFYNLTYALRRDGILSPKNLITGIGSGYYAHILRQHSKQPAPHSYEKIENPSTTILVTYDIPEKLRKKRAWLRSVLKSLDYEMLHQSAWISNVKIPEELLQDLRAMGLLQYIQIVAI